MITALLILSAVNLIATLTTLSLTLNIRARLNGWGTVLRTVTLAYAASVALRFRPKRPPEA